MQGVRLGVVSELCWGLGQGLCWGLCQICSRGCARGCVRVALWVVPKLCPSSTSDYLFIVYEKNNEFHSCLNIHQAERDVKPTDA